MSVQQKIDYDLWANQQVMAAIKSIQEPALLSEATRLFAHLFKAQVIWYNRVKKIDDMVQIWGDYTIEECESLLHDSPAMLEGIAAETGNDCTYTNSKGVKFSNPVSDIFEHIIIHGQHHRAQISSILRKAGMTPPGTDYILYIRTIES